MVKNHKLQIIKQHSSAKFIHKTISRKLLKEYQLSKHPLKVVIKDADLQCLVSCLALSQLMSQIVKAFNTALDFLTVNPKSLALTFSQISL